jgi:hypothetical protein
LETIAIIALGALTIPSIRKLLINRPGLPGGRLVSEGPPPLVSLPSSGAKGSRRARFSRAATGFIAGAVAEVGTSDFAAGTDLDLGDFAVEIAAAPEETLLPEAAAGFTALAVPGATFVPSVAPEEGFAAELPAGLAVAAELLAGLAVASGVADPAGKLGAEPDVGLGAAGDGLIGEVVGGAGFEGCCFAAAAPEEAG